MSWAGSFSCWSALLNPGLWPLQECGPALGLTVGQEESEEAAGPVLVFGVPAAGEPEEYKGPPVVLYVPAPLE